MIKHYLISLLIVLVSFIANAQCPATVDPVVDQTVCNGATTSAVNFTGAPVGVSFAWVNNNTGIGLPASGSGNIPGFIGINNGISPLTGNITVTPSYTNFALAPGWQYSTQYNVTENSGTTITDYQLRMVINTQVLIAAGEMDPTGKDIRFGYNNGAVLFNYWIESGLNTSTTVIWVKIDVLPASAIKTFYMYYGNPSATPVSAVQGTFIGPNSATDSVANGGAGGVGNSQRGFRFSPKEDLIITSFGKREPTGSTRYVTLFDYNSQAIINQTQVSGPAGEYSYTDIANPIWLTQNTQYLLELYQGNTDGYYFGTSSQIGEHLTYYDMRYCNSCGQNTFPTNHLDGYQYGYPDLWYYVKNNVTPAPTYVEVAPITCSGTPVAFNINVNPTPIVNAVTNQTFCAGSSVPAIIFTSPNTGGAISYSWSRTNEAIGLGVNSGTGNVPTFTATNTGTTPLTSTFSVVASFTNNGVTCTGSPIQFTVTINPNPIVNTVANQSYCVGSSVPSVLFTSNVPGAVFSWSRTNEAIGLSVNSGTGNVPVFTATNTGTTPLTSTFSVVASFTNNGVTCTGAPIQFTITVNPNPSVNAVTNITYCVASTVPAVVFTSNVAGAVFSWSRTNEAIGLGVNSGTGNVPSFTSTNSGTVPLTATFSVVASYTNNGVICTGTPIQFTITINPSPIVNAVSNQTFCSGSNVPSISFSGNVAGATFSWSRTNEAIGLGTTSGTGNVPAFTTTNVGTSALTSTFSVVASISNNGVTCTGSPIQFTITVNPNPTVNTVANQTYCVGNAVPSIVFTSPVPGAVFSWSRTNEAIGLGVNSGNGNVPGFISTNSGSSPLTATFSVVASYTNNGVTCTGTPIQFTITINPNPIVNAVANQSFCPGSNVPSIIFTGNVPGAVYSWTRTNEAIGLGTNSGTGSVPGFVSTNSGTTALVSTFSVIASYTNNGVTCSGPPIQFTITVNPSPQVNAVANQSYCLNSSVPSVVFTSPVPGAVFSWSRTNEAIGLSVNSGTGNVPAFTSTNSGSSPLTATFSVVASYTNNGLTCNGTPIQFTITINPNPSVNAVANQQYCSGSTVPSIVFTGNVPGAVYSWSRTNEAIGLGVNSGTGNVPAFTATNSGTTPLTSTFSVVASFTNNGVTCTGAPIQFTITINPSPQVNAVTNQSYCVGSSVPSVVFTSNIPGASFSWSRTNEAIGLGVNSGVGNVPAFTSTNAGTTPLTATFSVVASYTNNGVTCTGTPIQFTITINPAPTVNTIANLTYCVGSSVPSVVFTSPNTGGAIVYNWTRTNVAIGLAALSGVGNVPAFTAVNPGSTVLSSLFSVTASYTNNGVTCSGPTMQFSISVNPVPQVNPVASIVTCNNTLTGPVNFSSTVSGTVFNWTNNNATIGLGASGTGNIPQFTAINNGTTTIIATITVTPTYTNGGVTCTGTPITFTITIAPSPVASCKNATIFLNASGIATLLSSDINNGSTGGTVTISKTTFNCSNVGQNTVILTVTDVCGKTSTCSAIVTVVDNIPPVINNAPANVTIQCDQAVPAVPVVTATDNCSASLSFTQTSNQSPWPQLCGYYSFTITRTWIATDPSGNTAIKVQTISVVDNKAPVWKFTPPAFLTVECDDDNSNNVDPIPYDACDGTPSVLLDIDYDFGIYNCVNNYLATYTWTAGDKCGNTIQYVQKITVVDTTGPEMACPENIIIKSQTPTAVSWVGPKVSDYCDHTPTTIQIAGPPSGSIFQPNTVTTIIYQSTDQCGNVSTCSFTVTIKSKGGASKPGEVTNKTEVENNDAISFGVNQYRNELLNTSTILYQNEPNPFDNNTVIRFYLPESQEATLNIYTLQGKLIKEIKEVQSKGEHRVTVSNEEFPTSGIYYYQLKTNNFTDTKKMLYVK